MHSQAKPQFTIWYVTDQKAGHLNQILGLVDALKERLIHQQSPYSVEIRSLFPEQVYRSFLDLVKMLMGFASHEKKAPDIVIGCGHRTHLALLAISRQYRVPSVVIMKPSLPISWFDYVIAPEHDQLKLSERIFQTKGAMNRIKNNSEKNRSGLILIGGPSHHFKWDNNAILAQIEKILISDTTNPWLITTSPRTPESLESQIEDFIVNSKGRLQFKSYHSCEKNWLSERLSKAEKVWISPDSVSMIYESMSSGANVGVLELDSLKTRVSTHLQQLFQTNSIVTFSEWALTGKMIKSIQPLNEAARAANWLLEKLK